MTPALRGSVFRYHFGPVIGAELSGQRAALIISGDDVNQAHQYYIALPTSTSMPEDRTQTTATRVHRRRRNLGGNSANQVGSPSEFWGIHRTRFARRTHRCHQRPSTFVFADLTTPAWSKLHKENGRFSPAPFGKRTFPTTKAIQCP